MPARAQQVVSEASAQSSKKRPVNKPPPRAARTTVLHLCPSLTPGDPARETVDLAILTQRAGWRTLIASSGGPLVTDSERAAVRHTRMPLDKRGLFVNWRNRVHLEALIQKERPVLVHAHGISAVEHAFKVCRARHLPLLADLTQPLPDRPRMHSFLQKLGKNGCTLRVPSDFMARHLEETFHLEPESIYTAPPGIDLKWYDASSIGTERLAALSRLWRLPEQATVILMPMPLGAGTGHRELLQALAPIKRTDIFVVMVGEDREAPGTRAEIEALIGQLGLGGKVIMPDHCLDWPAACWLSSVIVAPNTAPRGQTLELLAAQAIGRPVIVSACGANPEMVLSGETAWIVPPGDIPALTHALREATELGTRQRLDLTFRTRDFMASAFQQATWFNSMMELYEAMLTPAKRHTAKAA
jgi:glycosyltransferase involved in cell wall biosynthesis